VLCAVERRWRDTLLVLAVGAAAAVSLLPYIPVIIRAQDRLIFARWGFRFSHGWKVNRPYLMLRGFVRGFWFVLG